MIQFRDAVHGDLVALAPHLRRADSEEWRMGSGKRPVEMIEDGFRLPSGPKDINRVALDERGSPLILYGINSTDAAGRGWVWLIAHRRAPSYYRQFVKEWDSELAILAAEYHEMVTASWVGNESHHRWLEAMGFERYAKPFSHGPYGALFQPFRKET